LLAPCHFESDDRLCAPEHQLGYPVAAERNDRGSSKDRLDANGTARQCSLGHDQTKSTRRQWIAVVDDVGNR
jgi:hypothetical protein